MMYAAYSTNTTARNEEKTMTTMTTMTAAPAVSIKCAHCKDRHGSVAEVRECAGGRKDQTSQRLHVGHAPSWPIDREYAREYEARLAQERENETRKSEYAKQREQLYPSGNANAKVTVRPGVYELAGTVYVVKASKQNRGRVYANRIVESPARLNEEGEHVNFELVYTPGIVYDLKPEMKMTAERAKHFLVRYGRCLVCRRHLKAAKSVERGIGPVCAKYFA